MGRYALLSGADNAMKLLQANKPITKFKLAVLR